MLLGRESTPRPAGPAPRTEPAQVTSTKVSTDSDRISSPYTSWFGYEPSGVGCAYRLRSLHPRCYRSAQSRPRSGVVVECGPVRSGVAKAHSNWRPEMGIILPIDGQRGDLRGWIEKRKTEATCHGDRPPR